MSETTLRRAPRLALIAIAAVWGLTFVMVQDAIELLPTMAFLAYRFIPAALIVARDLLAPAAPAARGGLARRAADGRVPHAAATSSRRSASSRRRRRTRASSPGCSWCSRRCSGAIFLRDRVPALVWVAAGVSMRRPVAALGRRRRASTCAATAWCCSCAFALAAHILATARAVRSYDVGALLAVQLGRRAGSSCLVDRRSSPASSRSRRATTVWSALIVTSLVASALGFFVQSFAQQHAPPARTALILASEPAFAGLFGWLLNDERLTATGWLGAALIMAAIVAVEIAPRFRPPRPLPEG